MLNLNFLDIEANNINSSGVSRPIDTSTAVPMLTVTIESEKKSSKLCSGNKSNPTSNVALVST